MAARAGTALLSLSGMASAVSPPPGTVPVQATPQVTPAAPGFEPWYQTPRNETPLAQLAKAYEALFGKISTRLGPSNPRWSTFSGELTPEAITAAFEQANAGLPFTLCDIYRRAIENDAHLAGVTLQTFAGIITKDDALFPPKHLAHDELAISVANYLRAVREQIDNYDDGRFSLLWAEGQGYAAAEIIYDYRRIVWYTATGERISDVYCVPVKLEPVDGRAFKFDTATDEPLLWLEGGYSTLPPAKFIFNRAFGFSQITERRGFMRSCIWLHAIKQWCIRDMATYLHLYGIPQMTAEYDPTKYKYEEARQIALKAIKFLGEGGIPTVPAELFRLRTDTPTPQWSLVHRDAAEWLNGEMTKVVTLGPLTMESSGGSYGLGDVHKEGAYNGQLLRAQNNCNALRRDLYNPALQLNKYRIQRVLRVPTEDILAVLPRYEPRIERETDPEKRQKVFSQAMKDGCPVSLTQYRGNLQLDAPKDNEDALKGEATPIPSAGATVSAVDASKGADAPQIEGEGAGVSPAGAGLELTSTPQGAVITVNEARRKMGLPDWPNEQEGKLSVADFMAKNSGTISKVANAEDGQAPKDSHA